MHACLYSRRLLVQATRPSPCLLSCPSAITATVPWPLPPPTDAPVHTCARTHLRAHGPSLSPLYSIGHGHSALERGFRLWYLVGPSGKHAAGGEGEASDEESSDEEGVTDHSALQVQHATSETTRCNNAAGNAQPRHVVDTHCAPLASSNAHRRSPVDLPRICASDRAPDPAVSAL